MPIALTIYAGNVAMLGLAATLLWLYAAHGHCLIDPDLDRAFVRKTVIRGLFAPAVFLISIPMAWYNPSTAPQLWWLSPLPLAVLFANRIISRLVRTRSEKHAKMEIPSVPHPSKLSPVSAFFILTFGLSWLIWIPLLLSHFGLGPVHIAEEVSVVVRLLGVIMPAFSALILTARWNGRAGLRRLLSRLTIWRVGWQWWAVAAVVQPALLLFCGAAFGLLGGDPSAETVPPVPLVELTVNIVFLLIATIGEEIGWRGVALPKLLETHSAVRSSVVLGALWSVWHIPFWLLLDTFDQFGVGYLALNFLLIFPMTFYITWFFRRTRASLLLPVVFHLTFNIVNVAWFPVTTDLGAFGLFIAIQWILALMLLGHLEPTQEKAAPYTAPLA